jgi:uncharacterized protein
MVRVAGTRRAAWLALLALCACPGQSAADGPATTPAKKPTRDVTAEDYQGPPLPRGHVLLDSAFGGKAAVEVEIANTPETTQRGLMWRRELAAGQGMLFIFEEEEDHSFWMKNTLIPLDLLYIGADLKVAGIVENAQPRTLTGRSVGRLSKYVLEVPGGWAAKAGVRPGGKVVLDVPVPH